MRDCRRAATTGGAVPGERTLPEGGPLGGGVGWAAAGCSPLRPCRDAGHLAPRDLGRRAATRSLRSLRARAFRPWLRDLGTSVSFRLAAITARRARFTRSSPTKVALRKVPRITARAPSGVAVMAPALPCRSEPSEESHPCTGRDPSPSVRDDNVHVPRISHQHGALGVMRGVSRSAARAARGSGQRGQRAVNAVSRKARFATRPERTPRQQRPAVNTPAASRRAASRAESRCPASRPARRETRTAHFAPRTSSATAPSGTVRDAGRASAAGDRTRCGCAARSGRPARCFRR